MVYPTNVFLLAEGIVVSFVGKLAVVGWVGSVARVAVRPGFAFLDSNFQKAERMGSPQASRAA